MPDIILPGLGEKPWGSKLNTAINAINDATDAATDEINGRLSEDALNNTFGGGIRGAADRKYAEVSGVVRPNNAGAWFLISDGTHRAMNVDSVATAAGATGTVDINFGTLGATRVVSWVCGPDESFAHELGLITGASVTFNQARITMEALSPVLSTYIAWDGTKFTSTSADYTASFSNGKLTITTSKPIKREALYYDFSVTPRGGLYKVNVTADAGAVTANVVVLEFRDQAGTLVTTPTSDMKLFFTRGGGRYQVDPSTISSDEYPIANIWFRGVFEVA